MLEEDISELKILSFRHFLMVYWLFVQYLKQNKKRIFNYLMPRCAKRGREEKLRKLCWHQYLWLFGFHLLVIWPFWHSLFDEYRCSYWTRYSVIPLSYMGVRFCRNEAWKEGRACLRSQALISILCYISSRQSIHIFMSVRISWNGTPSLLWIVSAKILDKLYSLKL